MRKIKKEEALIIGGTASIGLIYGMVSKSKIFPTKNETMIAFTIIGAFVGLPILAIYQRVHNKNTESKSK